MGTFSLKVASVMNLNWKWKQNNLKKKKEKKKGKKKHSLGAQWHALNSFIFYKEIKIFIWKNKKVNKYKINLKKEFVLY